MNEHPKLNESFQILRKKLSFYKTKMRHFEAWSLKKSESNGALKGDIQVMMKQMLKEIGIPQEKISLVLNGLYSNMYDFDASAIIHKVFKNKDDIKFMDLFNKDTQISKSTMNTYLYSLNETPRIGTMHTSLQLCGICVFIQFILEGGRGEIEGFGGAENLINTHKKKYLRKMNELYKEQQKQQMIPLRSYEEEEVVEEKNEENAYDEKLKNTEIVDDWETLCL